MINTKFKLNRPSNKGGDIVYTVLDVYTTFNNAEMVIKEEVYCEFINAGIKGNAILPMASYKRGIECN